jgi:hypothetical protein
MMTVLMLAVCATGAWAQQTETFGWEDGVSTALGTFGNVGELVNVNDFAYTGNHSLYMTENPIDGTPQVFVAWIVGLLDGDEVTVSYWTYDDTPGASPSSRIWGHYTDNDINSYLGSASGNGTYSAGTGWEEQGWTWTADIASNPDRTALCVEFRMYSSAGTPPDPDLNYYWCDDVTVTAPDHCLIFLPDEDPVSTEDTTFGSVKALFR